MSGEVNMIQTLRKFRGGPDQANLGGGQSRDIFRGGPVKKITLYVFVHGEQSQQFGFLFVFVGNKKLLTIV